jgi:zinc transporter 2
VEVIGGTIAKSIAIISDAIHLVSDLIGFVFSFVFLYLSKKEMDEKVSFGYHRMELIGALANIFIVWTMVLFIIF